MLKKTIPLLLSSSMILTMIPFTSTQAAENTIDLRDDKTFEKGMTEEFFKEDDLTFLPLETYTHGQVNNFEKPFAQTLSTNTITIKTGYYIKQQGYLTNQQLRDYVKYVDKQVNTLGWVTLATGFLGAYGVAIPQTIFMQFAGGAANFDLIKEKAYGGYGMGWVHMYAAGPNTLSIIPRRDFSKSRIVYVR